MVTSAGGISVCRNRSLNEGIAITTRMATGTIVQAISSRVLCVVREGVGLALALNLTMMTTSSASTNSEISVMITRSQSWNQSM